MARATPTKTKKTPPKRKPGPFVPQVHVRMYCQGLGDCFLLRFEYKADTFFDVLIDCGIYKASPNAGDIMNQIVDDIIETTSTPKQKNGHLDLLLVTHEHWDHISGFYQALEKFEAMQIDEIWQAWTENETGVDPVAKELLQKYKKVKTRLVGALREQEKRPGVSSADLGEAFEIMRFFGVSQEEGESGDKENNDAYAKFKKMIAAKKPQYRKPGDVLKLGETGVEAFVLGPPRDVVALGKDDPGDKDGYHKQATAFLLDVDAQLDDLSQEDRENHPFAPNKEIPYSVAEHIDYFRNLYAFGVAGHSEAFRSIDDTASQSLAHLALRLDSHINNTSLVVAFRLPSGQVLLFPGDAQAGNWQSWANLEKPFQFKEPKTDAHELLRNTVFYKVSHHGSHNATPRTYGLELMTNSKLRAMIPVDHEIAVGAGYGEMPLVEIMESLKQRTNGAMVRSDGATDAPEDFFVRSQKVLKLKTSKDGQEITRPMYCETTFEL